MNLFLLLSGNRMQNLWRSTALSSWWTTASWDSWVITVKSSSSKFNIEKRRPDLCSIFLLVSDRDKNLYVYMYLPEGLYAKCSTAKASVQSFSHATGCLPTAKESFGGMRLLRRADFNAGANINTFWRMPCRGALEAGSRKAMTWDNKHITWFGTPDGLFFCY